jgi:hypothetical protein
MREVDLVQKTKKFLFLADLHSSCLNLKSEGGKSKWVYMANKQNISIYVMLVIPVTTKPTKVD